MNKLFKILGPVLILVGSAVAYFSPIAIVDYIGIAVAALGLAISIVNVIKKADKVDWKIIVPVICFAIGGFCCGIAGIAEDQMTSLIMAVIGVVGILVGLITSVIKKAK